MSNDDALRRVVDEVAKIPPEQWRCGGVAAAGYGDTTFIATSSKGAEIRLSRSTTYFQGFKDEMVSRRTSYHLTVNGEHIRAERGTGLFPPTLSGLYGKLARHHQVGRKWKEAKRQAEATSKDKERREAEQKRDEERRKIGDWF